MSAPLRNRDRARGDLGDGALQTPAQVGGDHERRQSRDRDRDGDGDRGGVPVSLFGVELLA